MIQINQSFYKQVHYCTMSDPLSVISADMLMVRIHNEVVKPMIPPFYKRFLDDIYSIRNKFQQDII